MPLKERKKALKIVTWLKPAPGPGDHQWMNIVDQFLETWSVAFKVGLSSTPGDYFEKT